MVQDGAIITLADQ